MAPTLDQHDFHAIDATIVADSLNGQGQRLTTFVCSFPRFILSELNTHRILSRNSASSRAIPAAKMIADVEQFPVLPRAWMKAHRGMQGSRFFTDPEEIAQLQEYWLAGQQAALQTARALAAAKLSKQMINRLLEPYKWHTVILTGTEWGNFFALRAESQAEIHIAALAQEMLQAYQLSRPQQLAPGEWHIPFGDRMTWDPQGEQPNDRLFQETAPEEREDLRIKIATARCARISYENFEGSNDYVKDVALHDSLRESGHWSPFEHCARAMNEKEYQESVRSQYREGQMVSENGWLGNFRGFLQYRKLFPQENRTDPRLSSSV